MKHILRLVLLSLTATGLAAEQSDADALAERLTRGLQTLAGMTISVESTLAVRLPQTIEHQRSLSATLVFGPNGEFRIDCADPRGRTGDRERIFYDRKTIVRVNDADRIVSRAAATAFQSPGEIFLEATPISDLPSFVWWARRSTPADFVRAFDACQRVGQEQIDSLICDNFRLTADGATLTVSIPDDGVPRRWIIDGTAFLPAEFANQPDVSARRTENWLIRRNSQMPDVGSFSFNSALDPGYRELRDYLIEDPDASRRLVGLPMPEWSAASLSESAESERFIARPSDGAMLIAFVASWSVNTRDALPFLAALELSRRPDGRSRETLMSVRRVLRRFQTGSDASAYRQVVKAYDSAASGGETPRIVLVWLDKAPFVSRLISATFPATDPQSPTAAPDSTAAPRERPARPDGGARQRPPDGETRQRPAGFPENGAGRPTATEPETPALSSTAVRPLNGPPSADALFAELEKTASTMDGSKPDFAFPASILSVIDDASNVRDLFSISSLPTVFVVNSEGRIVTVIRIGTSDETPDREDTR
ncbi:MAG: hypothetical protein ABIH86_00565 [Planctomycetota bacterium]